MKAREVMVALLGAGLLQTADANVISNMNTGAVYPTIQLAHDAAHEGDTLFVYPGAHLEWGITITNGITLMGGDPATTILQAWPTPSGAVDRVMQIHAGDRTARMVNLTIRYGCRTNWWNGDTGGGVWVGSGAVSFWTCVFAGNAAPGGGGVAGGTLFSCVVSNNRATYGGHGGGAQYVNARTSLFISNYAEGDGGAVSYSYLTNSTVQNNSAQLNGGGASDSELHGCLIEGNACRGSGEGGGVVRGGGIYDCLVRNNQGGYGGGVALANAYRCTFEGNRAYFGGAGCYYRFDSCLMVGNSADDSGGGVDSGTLYHCTLIGNTSAGWPGGGGLSSSSAEGCILVSNLPYNAYLYPGYDSLTRCLSFPERYPGEGNLSEDPRFADAANGNYRLRVDSPCVDAGTGLTGADLDGLPRLQGSSADMGAYEYPVVCVSVGGANTPPYETWARAATNLQVGVNAASNDVLVLVSNGVHVTASEWRITNRIVVRSLYGPDVTSVDGQNARRCLSALTNVLVQGLCFTNGRADSGGGVYLADGATLRSCTVTRCFATNYGGGIFFGAGGGTAEFCVVRNNTAADRQGGGIYARAGNLIRNCLVVSNLANEGGGFLTYQGGRVENCTIAGNTSAGYPGGGVRFYQGGEVRNSIVYGNTTNDFGAVGSGHSVSHTCSSPLQPGPGNFAMAPLFRRSPAYHLVPTSPCVNAGSNDTWMAEARDLAQRPRLLDSVVDVGAYELQIAYVAPTGTHAAPFGTLATAATNLQAALDFVPAGGVVRVAEGRYVAAHTNLDLACAVITSPVEIAAVGARDATVLDGQGLRRVLTLLTNAVVSGLTLSNGVASGVGGGAYLTGGGTLVSCTVVRGTAGTYGGGVFLQTTGVIAHCTFQHNTALTNDGGAIYLAQGGLVDACRILNNTAKKAGGLFLDSGGRVLNTIVAGNTANGGPARGGGLLFYNGGRADHCTIISNTSATVGGGVFCDGGGQIVNSIIYFNDAPVGTNNVDNGGGLWDHCCTTTSIGTACTVANPLLATDYRLATNSPCLDIATEILNRDIDGQWRPLDGDDSGLAVSDLGAYELMNPLADSDWDQMPDGWEQQYYGSPFGCPRPLDDDDEDGDLNRAEALADTNPLDANDWFRLADLTQSNATRAVWFASSSNRVYTLQISSNANPEATWITCPPTNHPGNGTWMAMSLTNTAPALWSRVRVQVP